MYSFVVVTRPKSYNSKKSLNYELYIQSVFKKNYPAHTPVATDLYGLVYHFFRSDIGIDADNLSKPVWDCLKGVLYVDDKQVKMRIAGSFDLMSSNLTVLDFSGLPGALIDSLLAATETEEHVLYVECGKFTMDMVRLNLGGNGN